MADVKTMNSQIIIRNDNNVTWFNSNPILAKGEIGISYDINNNVIGLKIGNDKNWNDTRFFEQTQSNYVFNIEDIIDLDFTENTYPGDLGFLTYCFGYDENDDSIPNITNVMANMIVTINNWTDSNTYIYGGHSDWELNSIYDENLWVNITIQKIAATKTRLENPITLAGDYTQIGNITKGATSIKKNYYAAGTSIEEILNDILCKEVESTITEPSIKISLTAASSNIYRQIGTTISNAYTIEKNYGKYTYGPILTEDSYSRDTFTISVRENDIYSSNSEMVITDDFIDNPYYLTCKWIHSDGPLAFTNLENTGTVQILGGDNNPKTAVTKTITGFYPYYYGSFDVDSSINETAIKGLTASTVPITNTSINIQPIADAKKIVIALPARYNKKITQVLLTSAMNTPITDAYVKQTNQIEMTFGSYKTMYNIWIYQPAKIDSTERHKITFGS